MSPASLLTARLLAVAGDLDRAHALLTELRDRQAGRGDAHELARTCLDLVWVHCWRGDLAAAGVAANDAVEWLLQLDAPDARAHALAARAQVDAYAGRDEPARSRAEEAVALLAPAAASRPRSTLAFLHLSRADHEAAAAHVSARATPGAWCGAIVDGDAAEALVGVGRTGEAEAIVSRLEMLGAQLGAAAAIGARGRGLILAAAGALPEAECALDRARTAHERLAMPIAYARTLLALGRVRRRQRKRTGARSVVDEAAAIFNAVGSARWADQARGELTKLDAGTTATGDLTPNQERVARLAASGLTNREVAASLVVSSKTVEAHLARAYRKLGIRSRAELGAHMALSEA